MGKVKKILASKKVRVVQNHCGIELCETVHFHMPGFRFELTAEQFQVFAETVAKALQKWISLGKPVTADFIVLANKFLPGEPLYGNRFEIEEQTVPVVHVHLRSLSIRPSIQDFQDFANTIAEAKKNLKK